MGCMGSKQDRRWDERTVDVNVIASSSDPEILSAFNEASPHHQSHSTLQPPAPKKEELRQSQFRKGVAFPKCHAQQRRVRWCSTSPASAAYAKLSRNAMRLILKGYGVRIDERDVSMDAGYKEELIRKLGPRHGSNVSLSRVFTDGEYLGRAEELRQMHDAGKLGELLECCEMASPQEGDDTGGSCEACSDVRFVPCRRCLGSCKVYREVEEEDKGVKGF
ncbi:hypothetical protein Cni_G02900 [Canna indica]|uniref:Glutaredoxin domain-containing protein n=1 Tax=Canna indica TaxID=4628 RepID=A0AAQ3JRK7_9LILI|nr:hypothetical protein Cni_G02900 [Canna indica]